MSPNGPLSGPVRDDGSALLTPHKHRMGRDGTVIRLGLPMHRRQRTLCGVAV